MSNPPRDPIQPHRTRPASEVAHATGALADARLASPRRSRQPPSPSWFESFVVGCDPIACALFGVLAAGVPPSPRRARPGRSPRGAEPFPERYYVGRRPASSTPQVFLVGEGVEPLRHPGFRTTAGFDWGRDTAGALELAYAMLTTRWRPQPPRQPAASSPARFSPLWTPTASSSPAKTSRGG